MSSQKLIHVGSFLNPLTYRGLSPPSCPHRDDFIHQRTKTCAKPPASLEQEEEERDGRPSGWGRNLN
ncbi:unnamed protein product [Boreogadus saida]